MLIVKEVRRFAVPLGLAPGAVTPWFCWAAAIMHLALRRLLGVLVPVTFFVASEVSVSIGAVPSLAFFPDFFCLHGKDYSRDVGCAGVVGVVDAAAPLG